jgi:hypothetical protein
MRGAIDAFLKDQEKHAAEVALEKRNPCATLFLHCGEITSITSQLVCVGECAFLTAALPSM